MSDEGFVLRWRRRITVTCAGFAGGVFWGMLIAGLLRWTTDISEFEAMAYVVLPISILVTVLLYPKLVVSLGFISKWKD